MDLPGKFIDRYLTMYGGDGQSWLDDFTTLRDELRKFWSLSDPKPLSVLSFNYLEYVTTSSGQEALLKIGYPHPELGTEIRALRAMNGEGVVKLIDAKPEKGALLLERIIPGHKLLTVCDDENATRIAGQVMTTLWRAAPEGELFPSMERWCAGFERYQRFFAREGPIPAEIFQRAWGLAKDLLTVQPEKLLLHGDLHHQNILMDRDGNWLAIDPKGVIGEKAFEIGPLLYNPIPELSQVQNVEELIQRRLEILAEITGIDRVRMVAWSYIRAVLSSIWEIEDGGENRDYWIKCSELLKKDLRG